MNKEKYANYFNNSLENLILSKVTITGDSVIVADLFTSAYNNMPAYTQKVPSGEYDVKACIIRNNNDVRIAAVTVDFTDKEPINFSVGVTCKKNEDLAEDDFFGFPVSVGLASVFDYESLNAYFNFESEWYEQNPEKDIYDDYFADLFKKSCKKAPLTQRECGDYIDFLIPNTDYHIPFFSTGFGNGYYPVYFGYSDDNVVCCMLIVFIDL